MFQNALMTPITLKRGLAIGRATMGGTGLVVMAGENIDWSDLVWPDSREHTYGRVPLSYVRCNFYDDTVRLRGMTDPHAIMARPTSLAEELDFLADMVHIRSEIEPVPVVEPIMASEALAFTAEGKEIPRQRSISEDELWRRI